MSDVIKTIGGTTPDYTTWTLFEAAIPTDISSATGTGEHWIGKGRDVAFNENFAVAGITTDTTNRVTLTYDTGAMHDGRSRDVSGSGCQIHSTGTGGVVRPAIQHMTIDGLEIKCTQSTAYAALDLRYATYTTGNETVTKNCILQNTGTTTTQYVIQASQSNLNYVGFNDIIYGYSRIIDTRNSLTATLSYLTCFQHADQLGILGDTELTCKNTYCGKVSGTAEDFWTGGAAPSGSNNASSDTSATTDYTSSLISKAPGSQFTNITAGSEDFSLKAGSDLEGFGTNISGITTDIIGTARHATAPDIGAFENVAVGGVTGKSNPLSGPLGGPLAGAL